VILGLAVGGGVTAFAIGPVFGEGVQPPPGAPAVASVADETPTTEQPANPSPQPAGKPTQVNGPAEPASPPSFQERDRATDVGGSDGADAAGDSRTDG
jgi:hypothetical protein